MPEYPPDDRLDGPIHEWFSLSYSNYLVLERTLMQSMPTDWQQRMVACLEQLGDAFTHVDKTDVWWVQPARECSYSDLTETDMTRLWITPELDDDGRPEAYYDAAGDEHQPDDRILVPSGVDPVPHYDRGRTYIRPRTTEETA